MTTKIVSRIVGFFRAGYPEGMPARGYVALCALQPARSPVAGRGGVER